MAATPDREEAPMDHAEFARRMAETTQRLREIQQCLAQVPHPRLEPLPSLARLHRFVCWVQVYACIVIVVSLLVFGYAIWQHLAQRDEHAALTQALRTETQTLAAQTQTLRETLRQGQP
jgi:cytochrome c-type biogenesis protein CcmH/NrfG